MAVCAFNPHKILQSAGIISFVHLGKLGASVLKATNAPALVTLWVAWLGDGPTGELEPHAGGRPLQRLRLQSALFLFMLVVRKVTARFAQVL